MWINKKKIIKKGKKSLFFYANYEKYLIGIGNLEIKNKNKKSINKYRPAWI